MYMTIVQFCSVTSDSLRPHGLQNSGLFMSFTISWSLLKLTSIESVMPPNHLILCRPLLHLPSIFPNIRVFYNLFHKFPVIEHLGSFQLLTIVDHVAMNTLLAIILAPPWDMISREITDVSIMCQSF